jgi:salicylate hydroxylase
VCLRLRSRVSNISFEESCVFLEDGERISADVIVGADGIHSVVRRKMVSLLGHRHIASPTGDAAFRYTVPFISVRNIPEFNSLKQRGVRYLGPSRHVVCYPLAFREVLNLVLVHPDKGSAEESWTSTGSKEDIQREYCGWDPVVQRVISCAPDTRLLAWKLVSHPPLPTWTTRVSVLAGDACHPTL